MPAAVTAVVSAIGTAIGGTAGAFMIMNATAIASVTVVVGSLAIGNHQRRKAKAAARAAYNASLEDRLVMLSTASGARSRCYGRVRNVDGILFKATRGTNKEFYTLFIAVAGHEIDAFETVYFGDTAVTLDANGYVLTAPFNQTRKTSKDQSLTLNGSGGGSVTATGVIVAGSAAATQAATASTDETALTVSVAGSVITVSGGTAGATARVTWQESASVSNARVRFYTGAAGQDLSTVLQPLFPSLITTGQHRFAGIAGMLVDLEYETDAWPTGVPNISATFRGAKCFDPRTGLTAWTENPAIIARDWALYSRGGGCLSTHLIDASFTAAANACDTSTSFPVTTGTVSLPLYTCGIVARLDDDPWGTFQEIVEAMAGKAGWAGGQLRVVAGVYRAPVATITEDWISDADPVQIVPEPPTDEAVNIYRPQISDKAQAFVAVQAPEVRAASYITADGRELPREMTLGGVTDTVHAQHVCGVLMRDARNALTVVLPCNLRAFQLELFDVVSVTLPRFGWSAKTFEVVGWRFGLSGGVELTLKETAAAIYQPDSTFAVLDVTPNTALPSPTTVPTMGTLTITSGTSTLTDGTQVTRVNVAWPAPADRAVSGAGQVELQYWPTAQAIPAGDWVQAPPIPGNALETTLTGLKGATGYVFRARFVNALGVRGQWGVQVRHITAAPPAVAWDSLGNKPADSEILNSYAVIGQNLLAESDQAAAVRMTLDASLNGANIPGGAVQYASTEGTWTTANYVLVAGRTRNVYVRQLGRHTGTTTADSDGAGNTAACDLIMDGAVPCVPGQRYFASAYGVAHRCNWRVYVAFYNTAGTLLQANASGIGSGSEPLANALSLYDRLSVAVVAPAGAAQARLVVRKYNTKSGQTDSYLWVAAPQLEVTAANALGPSPYMPGPASAVAQLGYLGALDATRGAPAGTLVGSTAATTVEANAANALANAATAQSTANTASGNATSALSTLATMRSNGYLDAAEKPALIREWQAIAGEYAGIVAQATAYGLSSSAYTTAYSALGSYLSALSPSWTDTTQDTPITPATDQAKWLDYYNARQALLNAIADEAGKRAQWALVTGSGKPSDNATRDITLVNAGGMTVLGNTISKATTGNSDATWDSSVYSRESYTGGAYVSFVPAQTDKAFMVGLNTDPTTNSSYASIDWALYAAPGGNLYAYESDVSQVLGTYVAGDALAVTYDGATVRYYKNGTVLRSVTVAITLPLYLDSSFYHVNARADQVVFGPMSAVRDISTGQLAAEAATKVYTNGPATATITQLSGIQGTAPGPYRRRLQTVASVTFTASVTGHAFAEAYGSLTCTTGGTAGSLEWGVRSDATYSDDARIVNEPQAASITNRKYSANISARIPITAGVSYTIVFGAAKFDNSMTLSADDIELSVTEIRR